jgi:hypothetical protein
MQTQDLLTGVKTLPESSGQQEGILAKNPPAKINYIPILQVADQQRVLNRAGIYGKANYAITREGIPLTRRWWSLRNL